jgi:4-hydroxyphenylpyruvate dioxygenase
VTGRQKSQAISDDNPMGTDGFEFVEFAHPEPDKLGALFELMGFSAVARHRSKRVTLYRQGDVNYVLNAEPDSFAAQFTKSHGPSACAIHRFPCRRCSACSQARD